MNRRQAVGPERPGDVVRPIRFSTISPVANTSPVVSTAVISMTTIIEMIAPIANFGPRSGTAWSRRTTRTC